VKLRETFSILDSSSSQLYEDVSNLTGNTLKEIPVLISIKQRKGKENKREI
jgi:hypothetical protein